MAPGTPKTIFFWSSRLEAKFEGISLVQDVDHFLSFPLDACEDPLNFTLLNALLKIGAFVCGILAFSDSQGKLYASLLPVHFQRHKRSAGLLSFRCKLLDFCPVQEQPATAPGLMLLVTCAHVRLDVAVVEIDLCTFESSE